MNYIMINKTRFILLCFMILRSIFVQFLGRIQLMNEFLQNLIFF